MRNKVIGGVVVLVVILFLGAFYASPYWVLKQASDAYKNKDIAALSPYIDYPRLQTDVKNRLMKELQVEIDKKAKPNSTFAGFASILAESLTDKLSKEMVTPEGLQALIEGKSIDINHAAIDEKSTDQAVPATALSDKKYNLHYLSLNQFGVDVPYKKGGDLVFTLERQGLFGWKLVGIQFPDKL